MKTALLALALSLPTAAGQEPGERPPAREAESGFLGVVLRPADRPGALVARVVEGSPAARAGIERGDRITAVGESAVDSPAALVAALGERRPGERVELALARAGGGGEEHVLALEVELGRRPAAADRGGRGAPEDEPTAGWQRFRRELQERWRGFAEREEDEIARLREEALERMEGLQEHLEQGFGDLQERLERFRERDAERLAEGLRERVERFQEELRREGEERSLRFRRLREELEGLLRGARPERGEPSRGGPRSDRRAPPRIAPPAPPWPSANERRGDLGAPVGRAELEALREEVRRLRREVEELRQRQEGDSRGAGEDDRRSRDVEREGGL